MPSSVRDGGNDPRCHRHRRRAFGIRGCDRLGPGRVPCRAGRESRVSTPQGLRRVHVGDQPSGSRDAGCRGCLDPERGAGDTPAGALLRREVDPGGDARRCRIRARPWARHSRHAAGRSGAQAGRRDPPAVPRRPTHGGSGATRGGDHVRRRHGDAAGAGACRRPRHLGARPAPDAAVQGEPSGRPSRVQGAFSRRTPRRGFDAAPVVPGGLRGHGSGRSGPLSLSCCVRRDVLASIRNPRESAAQALHRHLVGSCRGVREALDGAELHGPWLAAGPIRPGAHVQYENDIFRVGTLAGEAHPIVAEGIAMAIQSGWLLARELAGAEFATEDGGVRPACVTPRPGAGTSRRAFAPRTCSPRSRCGRRPFRGLSA